MVERPPHSVEALGPLRFAFVAMALTGGFFRLFVATLATLEDVWAVGGFSRSVLWGLAVAAISLFRLCGLLGAMAWPAPLKRELACACDVGQQRRFMFGRRG